MNFFESIPKTINDFFATYDANTIYILEVFFGITILVVLFRIIIFVGYQSQYLIFNSKVKKTAIEQQHEDQESPKIKQSKFGLINKILNEAREELANGVVKPNTKEITKKYLLKLKFLVWSYPSIESFITSFEQGLVLIGILLTLFMNENKELYAIITISTIIGIKIITLFNDYVIVKQKLITEISLFIDRQIATVDQTDLGSSISKFSKEVYVGIMKQADVMKESIDKLGSNLTGALALSIAEMSKAVESSVDKAVVFTEGLEKPIQTWIQTIDNASLNQEKINIATENLSEVVTDFNETSKTLNISFSDYVNQNKEQEDAIKDSISILVSTIEELKLLNQNNKIDYDQVNKQLNYIDKNQIILDKNIQNYEVTLETIVSKIGTSLGEIVDLQMQNSYIRLNEILLENINLINMSNKETLTNLYSLFDDLQQQTKNQTQTILRVKEQMDVQFDMIREKI